MDDPVCTKEAIPVDECRYVIIWVELRVWFKFVLLLSNVWLSFYDRTNKNVLLGLTKHGGHLAFFGGLTASNIWYVN